MKSIIVSVMFCPWVWLKKPWAHFLYASYAAGLSVRDSIKSRRIIEHPEYNFLFSPEWKLTQDQNQKTKFVNTYMGQRLASSTGAGITGDGGDFIIVDDPHSKNDSKSDVKRQSQVDWYFETMSTRGNDPNTVCNIVVMQRLHDKDLSGEILERGGYEHLLLPAEYDPGRAKVTSIGFKDPRTEAKQLLWPEHFNADVMKTLKKKLGPVDSEGQLNQDPKPAGGGTFPRKYWQYYKDRPSCSKIWQFWDCAEEPGLSNDFSVCATWGEFSDGYALLDLWRAKVTAPILQERCIEQAEKWRPHNIVIEKKSAGTGLIQFLRAKTKLPVLAYNPKESKVVRALNATPVQAAGRLYLPRNATWRVVGDPKKAEDFYITTVEDILKEAERFPNVDHDDIVDTISCMVEHFNRPSNEIRIRRL